MNISVKVINPRRVEKGRPAFQAMHNIALSQQEFGKVGTILAGDACYESGAGHISNPEQDNLKTLEQEGRDLRGGKGFPDCCADGLLSRFVSSWMTRQSLAKYLL
jgi:hypothetical protein